MMSDQLFVILAGRYVLTSHFSPLRPTRPHPHSRIRYFHPVHPDATLSLKPGVIIVSIQAKRHLDSQEFTIKTSTSAKGDPE
jgi:hypothetical protein